MRIMPNTTRTLVPATLAAALMLGGCGGPAAPIAPPAPPEKFVFISAKDCAESGRLKMNACADLIDKAVEEHVRVAPTYKSLKACEAVEGSERCERTDNKAFRPRLLAFAVIIAGEQTASGPLYATIGGEAGFRAADKQLYLVTDDNLNFSAKALAVYDSNKYDGPTSGG
jgi:uncharacterized protein YgiB involved in biofilm formation